MSYNKYWACLSLRINYGNKLGVFCVFDVATSNLFDGSCRKNRDLALHYAHNHPATWNHQDYETISSHEILTMAGVTIEELLESR